MVSGAPAAQHIEITANDLQDALDRLEVQRQALERELAAVVAHHSSVQKALEAIQKLMGKPLTAKPASTEAVVAESTSRKPVSTSDFDTSGDTGNACRPESRGCEGRNVGTGNPPCHP